MLQVTFEDELEVNAVFAALDDRLQKMGRQLTTLRGYPDSSSNQFAIDSTQAAIRHAMRAKLQMLAAVGEPAESCVHCGAEGSTPHWLYCENHPTAAQTMAGTTWAPGIEQYQAESR